MTPVLVLGFGFSPAYAIGTDILHGAIFKSVGAVRQRTLGHVKARLSGWMFLGSAPMSLAGVALATWIEHNYGERRRGARRQGARNRSPCRRDRTRREELRGATDRRGAQAPLEPRPHRRLRDRVLRRLHRRPHLGRQRRLLRAHDAARLPAPLGQGGGYRHLPRRGAAVGRGHRALRRRQRRPPRRRVAPDRFRFPASSSEASSRSSCRSGPSAGCSRPCSSWSASACSRFPGARSS